MRSVRPLPSAPEPEASRRFRWRWMPLVGALLAAGSILAWPGSTDEALPSMSATEPASLSAAEPSYESPAADAFVDFMAAVNRGDVIEVVALLAADIPDVPGLGTVYHPSLLNDPALWEAGELDRQRVIRFVTTAAYSDVVVSSCVGFSDGPVVVVASCDYELARGFAAHLGLTEQTGKIFAFIVDGKVAGVAASAAHFQLAA